MVRAEVASELKDGAEVFGVGVAGARVSVTRRSGGSEKRLGVVAGSKVTYDEAYGKGTSLELEASELSTVRLIGTRTWAKDPEGTILRVLGKA